MKKQYWIYLLASLFMVACNSNNNKQDMDINQMIAENETEAGLEISEETLYEIIQSVPSPLELAAVIRSSGTDFNDEILNSEKNANQYASSYDKAINMGVYSGDLGYINMYEKSYMALNYLGAIKRLADDLSVGHFFDFATIKRLASNSDKMDSLLYISTSNFSKMDSYLRDQKRGNLSALIICGSWIEGLYLATEIASINPNAELSERIGEQKVVLDQILFILSVYEHDPYFAELAEKFQAIKEQYDQVTITYNYQEPETKEVNGRLVIINKSTTEVNITSEQLKSIRDAVSMVRSDIISHS